MGANLNIDAAFIRKWSPRYDATEHDEAEYKKIRSLVAAELASTHTLSKDTFLRILDWKSPRVKGIVRLGNFAPYKQAFRCASEAQTVGEKLQELVGLCGIGAPVGSTILHFMYPDSIPIMDIRTVSVLYHAGYIASAQRDARRYPAFLAAIQRIGANNPGSSLREIDRALFAYHKLRLERREAKPRSRSRHNADD